MIGVQRAYNVHDHRVARWLRRNAAKIDVVHAWPRGCLRTMAEATSLGIPALRESPSPHTASAMRAAAEASRSVGVELPATHSHAPNDEVLEREKREYAAATAVLVPSNYAKGEFIKEGFPERALLQHRYGCDLGDFPGKVVTTGRSRQSSSAVGIPRKVCTSLWRRGNPLISKTLNS